MLNTIRLLFLGDVVGEKAVKALEFKLPFLIEHWKIDFTIINGENMHQGRGFNEQMCKKLFRAGANVITGGDHSFDKHYIFPYYDKEERILRPANYPTSAPGKGYGVYKIKNKKIGVINLRGQVFFNNTLFCPFISANKIIPKIQEETPIIIIDFHAEATGEKVFFGNYLDGKVSAVIGTHTHIPTADETILPKGTAYISDVGACMPEKSIIGTKYETIERRMIKKLPAKLQTGEGDIIINGVVIDINAETGKAITIKRVQTKVNENIL